MARKRTIDPDLWTDDKVQSLPDARAVLLYIGLISIADDAGRFEWSARQIWSRVFPAREDVKLKDVEAWMDLIVSVGLIKRYSAGGREYAFHPSWSKHQVVNRPAPSKLPSPLDATTLRDSVKYSLSNAVNNSVSDSVSRQVPSDTDTDTDTDTVSFAKTAGKIVPKVEPGPTFGDRDVLVVDFLAVLAGANASGMIAESRVQNIRREIGKAVDELGADPVFYGLSECVQRNKTSLGYALACARQYNPAVARRSGTFQPTTTKVPSRGFVDGKPWSGFRGEEPIGFSSVGPFPGAEELVTA